eukprot:CAMPEP_0119140002 /NCGR_PEP_ID=MMETSP1310-20130426/28493_1 /TAXON_ID=464262 /ORGANISM="Genus nov. species nov., Strain RCC2339" /LENGTH=999 /DNA_ID=CAMNT_0007131329 /DNA_START=99 /DNA_END=3098 /DNA_ORIENTATION=+
MSDEVSASPSRGGKEDKWVQVQIVGFTAWVNSYLQKRDQKIENIETDFQDGLRLVSFLELAAGKGAHIKGIDKKPKAKIQKIQNLSLALDFIQNVLEVRLLGITSNSVYNGNLKHILGTIFSIFRSPKITQIGAGKGEDGEDVEGKKASFEGQLLSWVNERVAPYGVEVKDFRSGFQDGMAFGAIINSIDNDALDYNSLDKSNPEENLTKAFQSAESTFQVPQLLAAHEVMAGSADERSVVLYTSLLFHAWQAAGAKEADEAAKNRLQNEKEERIRMEEELQALRAQMEEINRRDAAMKEEHGVSIHDAVEELNRVKEANRALQLQLSQAAESDESAKTMDELERRLKELMDMLAASNAQAEEARKRALEKTAEEEALRKKIEELEARIKELMDQEKAAETSQEKIDLVNQITKEQEELKRLQEEQKRLALERQLQALKDALASELEHSKAREQELARLSQQNTLLQKNADSHSKLTGTFDSLKQNLEEHLQELYEWRNLEKLGEKQNVFDLKKVVQDIQGKDLNQQLAYFDQKLADENRCLLRLLSVKEGKEVMEEKVERDGWLYVKGRKDWSKKWCMLSGRTLRYFATDDTSQVAEACVDLTSGCEVVRQKAVKEGKVKFWPLKLTLSGVGDDGEAIVRKLFLRAMSKAERHSWFTSISRNCTRNNYIAESEKRGERPDTRILSFVSAGEADSVVELHVDDRPIVDSGISSLRKGILYHDNVHTISLCNASLGDDGANTLALALEKITGLRHLRVRNNKLTNASVCTIIGTLKLQQGLRELDLSHNRLTDDSVFALADLIREQKFKNLSKVDLSGNIVSDKGASAFIGALAEVGANFVDLDLANNKLTDAVIPDVLRLLENNSNVKNLNLQGNDIGDEGATALAEGLRENLNVAKVDLSSNQLSSAGAGAWSTCMKTNKVLVSLNLSDNRDLSTAENLAAVMNVEGFVLSDFVLSRRTADLGVERADADEVSDDAATPRKEVASEGSSPRKEEEEEE